MAKKDFLFELGLEEMPPKLIEKALQSFKDSFIDEMSSLKISMEKIQTFATPRRLALFIKNLECQQEKQKINKKGPAIDAKKEAINGFARSCGVGVKELVADKKYYFFIDEQEGKNAKEFLPIAIKKAINKIPIKKPMYWGDGSYCFIRPVKWMVMLLDEDIIDTTIMGVKSSRLLHGLRNDAKPYIEIERANQYEKLMADNFQIDVDFSIRRNKIFQQINKLANENNANAIIDEELLNEVNFLVEHPLAFIGTFDKKFLTLPKEILISSMKKHQKYFHMMDAKNNLLPNFIAIANSKAKDLKNIINGNEMVVLPRLEDAKFFWEQDIAKSSQTRLLELEKVAFMDSLGSLANKSKRMASIAKLIAIEINENKEDCFRAALLSKTDLVSEVVNEFPNLQGIMGSYYALQEQENTNVVNAIREHYKPKFAGDEIPCDKVSMAVAIADKIDTITGVYYIGKQPSASKDPYALRRLALGLLRIFIEAKLNINLYNLIGKSLELHNDNVDEILINTIYQFMMERLKYYYADKNIDNNVFMSVLAINPKYPFEFDVKVKILNDFIKKTELTTLVEINKRINNILQKHEDKNETLVNPKLFIKIQEEKLLKAITTTKKALIKEKNYKKNIEKILKIETFVSDFFDNVMINYEDKAIRNNRIALIKELKKLFFYIGDISQLSQFK